MDDLARELGMSKKTIYTIFPDKRSLMIDTIDRFFDTAMEEERAVLEGNTMSAVDKLELILSTIRSGRDVRSSEIVCPERKISHRVPALENAPREYSKTADAHYGSDGKGRNPQSLHPGFQDDVSGD